MNSARTRLTWLLIAIVGALTVFPVVMLVLGSFSEGLTASSPIQSEDSWPRDGAGLLTTTGLTGRRSAASASATAAWSLSCARNGC